MVSRYCLSIILGFGAGGILTTGCHIHMGIVLKKKKKESGSDHFFLFLFSSRVLNNVLPTDYTSAGYTFSTKSATNCLTTEMMPRDLRVSEARRWAE